MSDGPIPILGPDDLKFTAEPSDFTGLVAGELGTLGSDQDGFDEVFNEAATLAASAGPVLDSLDQDLADASAFLPEFDPAVPTNMLALLQPASDAGDRALASFNLAVPPDPSSGSSGTSTGGTANRVDTRAYQPSDFPGVQCSSVQGPFYGRADIHAGSAPQSMMLTVPLLESPGRRVQSLQLLNNAEGIFEAKVSPESTSSIATGDRVLIVIHPKTAGRKTCVVKVVVRGDNTMNTICVGVTIQP